MLKALRRWLSRSSRLAQPAALVDWARRHGHSVNRVRHEAGYVVEGRLGSQAWRLEWGAPQRDYVPGQELRLIAEIDLPRDLMVLVLNRSLKETLEAKVYEQFIDDVQTRSDTEAPAEVRWLVLYPPLTGTEMGRLRERYAAVASIKPWLQQWLDSPLNDALSAAQAVVSAEVPVAMTIHRGRLTLRTAMPHLDNEGLSTWFSVFEHALREARRLGHEWREAAGTGMTTLPGAWGRPAGGDSGLSRPSDEIKPKA